MARPAFHHCSRRWPVPRRAQRARGAQRGLSLVELMVGSAIGLVVLAGATRFFVDHVQMNRRAMLEARLHQDIRAAAELMGRGLRRAGYWQDALRSADTPAAATGNPYGQIESRGSPAAQATYSHSRAVENGVVDRTELGGFRLSSGRLQLLIGGDWQALTDPAVTQITRLVVTPEESVVPLGAFCAPACSPAQAGCPSLRVRRYRIELGARSTADPALTRALATTVHVRNDDLGAARCPAR